MTAEGLREERSGLIELDSIPLYNHSKYPESQ